MRFLLGLLVDLVLAGVASTFNFHPVADFLRAHPTLLYWACGALHVVLVHFLFLQTIAGHAKSADFLVENQRSAHERAWVWSAVGALGTSFIVPFCCSLFIHVDVNMGLSMAIVISPLSGLFGLPLLLLKLFPKLNDPGGIPDAFATPSSRLAVAVVVTAYLALQESMMFLALASNKQASGLVVFLGLFLSYLPMRLFLFYSTAHDRREIISVLGSFALVSLQLLAASPSAPHSGP